jgi:hypothetical protein
MHLEFVVTDVFETTGRDVSAANGIDMAIEGGGGGVQARGRAILDVRNNYWFEDLNATV